MPTGDPGLDESQERELSVYHVLDYAGQRSDSGILSGQATAMQPGERTEADRGSTRHHASGRHSDNVMTRTEVRIHAGTEKVASGKARLCKWVETDDVNGKVPVTTETVRVEVRREGIEAEAEATSTSTRSSATAPGERDEASAPEAAPLGRSEAARRTHEDRAQLFLGYCQPHRGGRAPRPPVRRPPRVMETPAAGLHR